MTRRKRQTRAQADAARRAMVWNIATGLVPPDCWQEWFALTFPTLEPLAWHAAPLDIRQQCVRVGLLTAGPEA